MNKLFDKLNLRPQERRLVVLIFFVVFVVLQFWFVRPYFKEWGRLQGEIEKTRASLTLQNAERAKVGGPAGYEARLKKLEGEGSQIGSAMSALDLQSRILTQVGQSGVYQNGLTPLRSGLQKPGDFFEEQSFTLVFSGTGEPELVDFLYNMGSGSSLVRVRDLSVSPDAGQYKLSGRVTLTASFQKKPPVAAPAKPATPVPVVKPAPLGVGKKS